MKILLFLLVIGIISAASILILNITVQTVTRTLSEAGNTDAAVVTEATSILARVQRLSIVLVIVVLAAAVAAWLLLSANLTKPLGFLASEISGIAGTGNIYLGDEAYKQTKVLNKRGDEIGQMSRSIGDMLAMLRSKIQTLKAISDGDLAARVELRSPQDTIGSALEGMTKSLSSMIVDIKAATVQVAAGSKQIADGAQMLAQGSTEQAATVERLSSSISEIAQSTRDNATMADRAASLASTVMLNAEKGSRQMDEMTAAVQEINKASQSISKVIKVIDDIAFQTNILALNAAVEAARAGQHGKGFAVVAEEVRNLAAKSAEAAKDTGGLITSSMEKAELGSRIAGDTAVSLAEIVSGISENSKLISSIAKSSIEQSTGLAGIDQGIDQVTQVVQQTSATAQESAAASEQMSSQSERLEELITHFKLIDQGMPPGLPPSRRS